MLDFRRMEKEGGMKMLSSLFSPTIGSYAVATFLIVCKAVVSLPICHFMHLQRWLSIKWATQAPVALLL